MASIPIHDQQGKKVGTFDVEPSDFATTINKQLLHDVVVMYQANLRQGSHKTKSRSEVAGTTKKMYRQKGTGNARAGSRRSCIRRGGGHGFAIRNRDYSYSLPRKAVQLATRMAIASKIKDGEVAMLDALSMDTPKTSEMASVLGGLGCSGKRILLATAGLDQNVYRSARNIPGVEILPVSDLNALSLLRADCVVFTKESLESLREQAMSRRTKSQAEPAKVYAK